MKAERYAYNKAGVNLTLQAIQRELVDSFNLCNRYETTVLPYNWTAHVVMGKGDWKHAREWLLQKRHYSCVNISTGGGMICPFCLCGSDDSTPWIDPWEERFNNPQDMAVALDSACGQIPFRAYSLLGQRQLCFDVKPRTSPLFFSLMSG